MRSEIPDSKFDKNTRQTESAKLNTDATKATHLSKRFGFFCIGFVSVGFLAGLEALMISNFVEACIFGGIIGLIVGSISAIWGERALHWILKLL
jgi:hypothetical protein